MKNLISSSVSQVAARPPRRPTVGQALCGTAVALSLLSWAASPAVAQVSLGMSLPGVSIGVNMPVYPQLVRVPNYPVYYAPQAQANFFFYDGMYWVYQQDNWYASSWYNGPWQLVNPQAVPLYVLRVPVRYYRNPPMYFRGWQANEPPRWGDHWGNDWSRQRSGWDHWDRRAVPAPAPLPAYQRQYSGNRYPQVEQQQALQSRNYGYQPRDAVAQQHYQQQFVAPSASPYQRGQQPAPGRAPDQQLRPGAPAVPPQQQPWPQQQQHPQQSQSQPRPPPHQQPQPPQQGVQRQHAPQGQVAAPAPVQAQRQGQGQGQGQGRGNEKGKGHEQDRDNGQGQVQGKK
jgi:hypothetical protein